MDSVFVLLRLFPGSINHHGDPSHNGAIVDVVRSVLEQGVDAALIVGGLVKFAMERA